jgi:hypothetical protein
MTKAERLKIGRQAILSAMEKHKPNLPKQVQTNNNKGDEKMKTANGTFKKIFNGVLVALTVSLLTSTLMTSTSANAATKKMVEIETDIWLNEAGCFPINSNKALDGAKIVWEHTVRIEKESRVVQTEQKVVRNDCTGAGFEKSQYFTYSVNKANGGAK